MILTIDGIEYDVTDKQLAQAIRNQQTAHDEEVSGLKKKLDEEEEEKKKMEKEKDKAEAAKDAALSSVLSTDAVSALVTERAKLIADATLILGDKMLDCNDCPKEIKAAVVDKVLSLGDLSGKSEEYIGAAYDLALDSFKKADDSVKKLGKDFQVKDKEGKEVTRESARQKYAKDHLGVEV